MAFEERVTPDEWLPRGEALVHSRLPLAVWGGIPGETADVIIHHEGRNRAHGVFSRTDDPSPFRVDPPCDKVERCGGCPAMHLSPAGQEDQRRSLVSYALNQEGLDQVKLGEFYPCPDGFGDYRHILKLGLGYNPAGKLKVGAWGRRNRRVIPVPDCPVVAPVLRKCMTSIAHWILALGIEPYNPETGRGILRAVVVRASRTTGEVMVTLVTGRRNQAIRELATQISQGVSEVVGVWQHINSEPGNAIYDWDEDGNLGLMPLGGKSCIEETLGGVTYRIGAGDFFQTNPSMAERLYERVTERLELGTGDSVVDLYCGVGGLALQAAKRTGWALGVEVVAGAITRARETARLNRIGAEFITGEVVDVLPEVTKRLGGRRPIVTVNPARRGLEAGVIEQIHKMHPRKIAYVSCNPQALARDLSQFAQLGYSIGEVELFDMFPNTPHVETVVVLTAADHLQGDEGPKRAPRRRAVKRRR